ncbi:MAG TPA: ABC transporter permease [Planctomycetota bacterium]|nr:ABC transporter permease [Planctomycetota bacterium]
MRRALVVARTEYLRAVRTKGFIIGVLLMPVLMSGGYIASRISERAADVSDRRFAVVDPGGRVWPALQLEAQRRDTLTVNNSGIWSTDEPREQVSPRFVPELYQPAPGEDPVLELSDRVRREELFGFVIIGSDVLAVPGPGGDRDLHWHTNTPTYDALPHWIAGVVNDLARSTRFAGAGIDRNLVATLSEPVGLRTMGLARRTAGGEVQQASESDEAATKGVPLVLSMMLFILVMSTAPALLNTVLEEKMQKIAEVLVATVDPFDLLLGKLLATTCVALTLSVIYLGAGLIFAHWTHALPASVVAAITPATLAWYALFQVLALLSFGSMYAAIGAACSEIQDAQNLMGPLMLMTMVPIFFLVPVLNSPDSPLSRVLSLIPTATPILMMMRVSAPPGPAWWELVLAVVITGGFAMACIWAGGRIFRMGVLAQGQAPSWRRLWSWVRAG